MSGDLMTANGGRAAVPPGVTLFVALMRRDLRALRRDLPFFLLRPILQPLLFVVVFGVLMPRMGVVSSRYGAALLPGVLALTLGLAAVQSVALPLVQDFGSTREIEDRATRADPDGAARRAKDGERRGAGAGQRCGCPARCAAGHGAGAGAPADEPRRGRRCRDPRARTFSAAGLVLGTAISPQQIGVLFSAIITPTIFFGCAYYPWPGLDAVPVLRYVVLVNPLTYVGEGRRAVLTPAMPHKPLGAVIAALAILCAAFSVLGVRGFRKRAFG